METNERKVITGEVRLSYTNIWEAHSVNGSEPKYGCAVLIPKTDVKTYEKINTAINAAYRDGSAKLKGNAKSVPALAILKTPLRDGDIDRVDDEAFAGCWFLNANSKQRPGVVDQQRAPITDQSEIYSGVYARISITFYAFNTNGNRGIACDLGNVQKLRDGKPLAGKSRAEDDFNDNFANAYTEDGISVDDFLA
ncbi:hypothetical protein FACS18948_4590 [Clostridia bacterium]|nr:hypothetical protein FACS18948_4590 [Clostridia bacterium]